MKRECLVLWVPANDLLANALERSRTESAGSYLNV
jgi:hypothetical protein